ncbi:penicillin acylase family protein [Roseateles sp. BYS180W]|uniref:Penicillin acylase family protein n=1 Tax=Roseateles rivi TaxID=3299028 RepID=A0ABW7FZX4_9BURK
MHRRDFGRARGALAIAAAAACLGGTQAQANADERGHGVEVRRTTDGLPHIKAQDWRGLGIGVGYAQAEDALCTLAEAFVTFEGRRSRYFGADERASRASTFGLQKNIDLDVFFRVTADQDAVEKYRAQQPADFKALIDGFAAGYNRYLGAARRASSAQRPACVNEPWVREIEPTDLYRRMIAAGLAGGYMNFIPELVNARPPGTGGAQPRAAASTQSGRDAMRSLFAHRVGDQAGVGSNMLAFGKQATGGESSVLLGNPHWYWGGPDRFYQMHLTIPGKLNVAGAAFLGIPVVMMGFNEQVAWSHTVSEARRFGLFDLSLVAGEPTSYRVGDKIERMQPVPVSIDVVGTDGKLTQQSRTVYRTRFGYVADFGAKDPAFGWGETNAIAVRDVNAENARVFRNYFFWNQAKSLDDFIAIQRREVAVPWVYTAAIGRDDGRVWYADIGTVPNVPDALRARCTTPLTEGFAQIDSITPFLDGSRAECDWQHDPAAVQAGTIPADGLPSLLREDYVANMNDSYWLTNPAKPLEGFPMVLGGEREHQSVRSRLGHRLALQLATLDDPSSQQVGRRLMRESLHPRVHSAELYKVELLAPVCDAARKADVIAACRILRRWANSGDAQDRGALLWEAFWAKVQAIPAPELYKEPFSSQAPLDTPARPKGADPRVAQALLDTIATFRKDKRALDAPLGSRRFVRVGSDRLPLYGGCHDAGYFTVICNDDGSDEMGPNSVANSYLQVVRFTRAGVEAHTMLAHGQRETALESGQGSGPVRRYARKEWLRFPFSEEEIARDPATRLTELRP